MAVRRMFSNVVIDTDSFLSLPLSAQCLYFHLGMKADDDGFIANAEMISRVIGSEKADLAKLIQAGYLLEMADKKIYVITDFKINNKIRSDRYQPTVYQQELQRLRFTKNKRYQWRDTDGIPDDNQTASDGIRSIDKYSIGESSIYRPVSQKAKFSPPTLEEVRAYCAERKNKIDPQQFIDYYEARGWVQSNGKKVDNWQACVITWERNDMKGSENYGIPGTVRENHVPGQRDLYGL